MKNTTKPKLSLFEFTRSIFLTNKLKVFFLYTWFINLDFMLKIIKADAHDKLYNFEIFFHGNMRFEPTTNL